MRLRASATNKSGIGNAGLSTAKAARLQSGNALAAPNTAEYFKKITTLHVHSFFRAGDILSLNPPLTGRSSKVAIIKVVSLVANMLTLNFRDAVVEAMKTFFRTILFGSLMAMCANSYALSENEAEDMADLTAVFVFLKNDCGYQNLPNGQIRRALVFFAQQNQWDLSNYDSFDMKALGEDSYRDLSGIGIPVAKKCKALARDSLSLLAYVK